MNRLLARSSGALSIALIVFGCDDPRPVPRKADGAAFAPEAVAIPASDVDLGFSTGQLRATASLGAFQISKYPTSAAQYAKCVALGGCEAADPSAACTPDTGLPVAGAGPEVPAVCVGEGEAAAYCAWVGGRLPTFAQWLLAARGPKLARYPWGAEPPTCDQHHLAPNYLAAPDRETREKVSQASREGCTTGAVLGAHKKGASPSKLEDALLTAGELLSPETESLVPACTETFSGCVIHGFAPGAIDAVEPVFHFSRTTGAEEQVSSVTHPYGFRCVWTGRVLP